MRIPSTEDIKRLHNTDCEVCVSIYLPMEQAGQETVKNPTRLKNMLKEAHKRLDAIGMDNDKAKELLAPLKDLEQQYEFWQHQREGVAFFCSHNMFEHYHVPRPVPELITVSNAFHLKPLIPALEEQGQFYLLSLAKKHVSFYHGTSEELKELVLEDLPKNMEEALLLDPERSRQQHHTESAQGAEGGRPTVMHHGHGSGKDEEKAHLREFFIKVERALQKVLNDKKAPLVISGVDYYLPIYKEVNTYSNLVEEPIKGSAESHSEKELLEEGWKLVKPHLKQEEESFRDRLKQSLAKETEASKDLEECVVAAVNGRAEAAFVALDEHHWGAYEKESVSIREPERPAHCAHDLLDTVAIYTIANGGRAYALRREDMPTDSPVAVLMRY